MLSFPAPVLTGCEFRYSYFISSFPNATPPPLVSAAAPLLTLKAQRFLTDHPCRSEFCPDFVLIHKDN